MVPAFIAETKKEALEQARIGAGKYQRDYFEHVMGNDPVIDGPPEKIVEALSDSGKWIVGTPDELVTRINQLDEESGGFGGLLVLAHEWGNREQMMKSYELIARYVMPQFQNSLNNLSLSEHWSASKSEEVRELRTGALAKAGKDYDSQKK